MHPPQRGRPPKGPPWPPNLGGCVRFSWFCVIWAVLWNSSFVISSGLPLNEYIRHFEPAYYPVLADLRFKRDINDDLNNELRYPLAKPLSFNITAHNRLFRISLHNNFAQPNDVFAEDVILENSEGPIDGVGIRKRIYSGILEDLPSSSAVHGIVTKEGLFDGHISTPDEHYYIEPASKYFNTAASEADEESDMKQPFHSVIYKASDVIHPILDNNDGELRTPCKSHELHLRRKEAVIKSNHNAKKTSNMVPTSSRSTSSPSSTSTTTSTSPRSSFSSVIGTLAKGKQRRIKRQVSKANEEQTHTVEKQTPLFENLKDSSHMKNGSPVLDPKNSNGWSIKGLGGRPKSAKQVVTTYEIVDWEDVPESVKYHFRKREEARQALMAGKGVIDKKKKTCMLYLQADHLFYEAMGSEEACIEAMTRHVQRVNSIYEPIDFDQDGKGDHMRFMIKRIKVHTSKALKDPSYRFPGNYGVEKFLEIFSEENYDAFCLAYMFTYRDFEGGTLGLAWTGDMKNAGGVCERNGHYRGTLKSLNTGIITLLNYGKHVPPAVSHVTMAHEMGHNFGSPHDPENNKDCVPGGEDGNYIMFARATSGDKINNRKFSPCSLKSIKPVLLSKAIGPKGCFQEPKMALCGNGVVEEGEECDCGWEDDCSEDCCWPQRTEHPSTEKPCTLKPKRDCSPSQGPCCTNSCTFNSGEKCLDDNGCREESFCDGTSSSCPLSQVKPNKTVCNKEFVCYKGECTGSICLAYGLESCQCIEGPDDSATKSCELCCKDPGEGKPCQSSFELNKAPLDVPDMFSKPGTPCNNYQGYCDVFQKCREVDPSGPLATLRKLLLSEKSIANLKRFLMRYWYTVIFLVLGVFILMAIIIKICGKKTPLVHSRRKMRRRTIQHAQEVIDNPDDVQVHPTTIEPSVPLGKKVRKGEKRPKKSRSKSRKRSTPTSTSTTSPVTSSTSNNANIETPPLAASNSGDAAKVEDGVARAIRLAANLGNQLFVDLPPEQTRRGGDTGGAEAAAGASNERKGRPGNKKTRENSNRDGGSSGQHRRKHKSLSPEKRLASTLAQSMSSISKSFEKLDLIGHHRKRSRSHHENLKQKQRKRSEAAINEPKPVKEVTVAKLGRFKFSVEVAKQFENERKRAEKESKKVENSSKSANKSRKISEVNNSSSSKSKQTADNNKSPTTAANSSSPSKNNSQKESNSSAQPLCTSANVTKLPSIHVTNFNTQKMSSTSSTQAQPPFNVPSVIVSKKRKERPRRESPEKTAKLDYRRSFAGNSDSSKFTRSISVPGPGPDMSLDEIDEVSELVKRNFSFANVQKPEVGFFGKNAPSTAGKGSKLKRSETERLFTRTNSCNQQMTMTSEAGQHLWLSEFDNQAYQKSPEPSSTTTTTSTSNSEDKSSHSLSLTSLSSPIHEAGSSKKPSSFDVQSATSSDSDLELVSQTPPVVAAASKANSAASAGISRAKILESVGVIVKNSSSANLLLPPSSSSPTSSSSASLTGGTSPLYEMTGNGGSDQEARLAFIGCESTVSSPSNSLNGHPPGGTTSSRGGPKRPSLSERYPTSPSSTSTTSSKKSSSVAMDEDNLDIISIITDGMT